MFSLFGVDLQKFKRSLLRFAAKSCKYITYTTVQQIIASGVFIVEQESGMDHAVI